MSVLRSNMSDRSAETALLICENNQTCSNTNKSWKLTMNLWDWHVYKLFPCFLFMCSSLKRMLLNPSLNLQTHPVMDGWSSVCGRLKPSEALQDVYVIPPVPRQKKWLLLFFLEKSFSIFIVKCNYRLLNWRRRPHLHTCHISLKAGLSVGHYPIKSQQPNDWLILGSFFALFPPHSLLSSAVRGGMCFDGKVGLVQTEPVVRRPTVTCRQTAETKSGSPEHLFTLSHFFWLFSFSFEFFQHERICIF